MIRVGSPISNAQDYMVYSKHELACIVIHHNNTGLQYCLQCSESLLTLNVIQTSRARAMMARYSLDEGPKILGSDCIAMLRLHRGAMSSQTGSRMPSRQQSFATGYIAPLPSRSITGVVRCKRTAK